MKITAKNYHQLSFKNKNILKDDISCYFCIRTSTVDKVEEWADNGETALCPHCSIDAVLPGKLSVTLLTKMCDLSFGKKVKNESEEK